MTDLVAFLRARFDEREAKAKAALRFHPAPWRLDPTVQTNLEVGRWVADANDEGVLVANGDSPAKFFADNDPQFVLDDVEAKRQLLADHEPEPGVVVWDINGTPVHGVVCAVCGGEELPETWPCRHVRLLALPYAGHGEFKEEWRA